MLWDMMDLYFLGKEDGGYCINQAEMNKMTIL